jgi:E3 ubiquitin-protein ligase RNF5
MPSGVGEPVAKTNSGGGKDAGSFECNICLDLAQDPVVTLCGHLFCWPCLYEWFHVHAHSLECPVCKAVVEEEKLVPLYGRGDASTVPRARSVAGVQIPSRPTGQRPSTAQPPVNNHYHHQNPWFMGTGGAPVAGGRWGDYTFSAAIGGLFPMLSFQVHGFPQAMTYGHAAGLPYGYGHSFHGWHGHGFSRGEVAQGHQVDSYLKILLLLVGVIVIASLIAF